MAAVLAVGFGSLANAKSASISANATVISEIVVNNVSNLDFGTVVVGQKKLVYAGDRMSSKVSTGTLIDNGSGGEFTISAQAGSDVTISFVLPTSLAGSTSGSLPITFGEMEDIGMGPYFNPEIITISQIGGIDTYINQNSPSLRYANFPTFDIGGGVNGIRVIIGGEVDATSATAGTYTGTITMSATYN
ncbi:hypothetical protein [uncultured Algoriphagus sp.]|uniref:hypothetical protein n=1 Tax=uncultured Algoriphagus sp. TaxID=417365 RepID=UPI0025929D2A|nr:hypothetical protein [uncultured Algoriphagus sp.]